jgi:hypothetical protein
MPKHDSANARPRSSRALENPFVVSLSNHEHGENTAVFSSLDKPVLSGVRSFDRLRTNGVEGLRTNGAFPQLLVTRA